MSTYVYGITHDSGSLDAAKLTGVGEPPSEVRFVRADGLAAAVSTTPEGLRAKRRDLAAHQEVLVELAREAAVLPMRFGAVAPDDEAVAAELRRSRDHYTALLDRLRDRVEVNVKATHIEEAALRAVLTENEELRRANERLREAGGGTPADRMAFGEQVAAALEDLRRRDADTVVEPLAKHADQVSMGPPVDNCLANVSLLVHRDKAEELNREVGRLQGRLGRLMEFKVNGPLPPYSFVTEPGR
ncbi:GvpL/GvpF family gas vesicle protein [Streptomonospora nanhaiensis]|uniref:GvpL/GvpF family gas vesicle protein n=1 Tax=Streptomonospora nanhaiensis TaxID=1323731 RepID=UPI001C993826|nr:GvpL/GvpF family gas vesicle protein [Streptomonospora nanhaiensis]MBX9389430.1 GvpL/GvpF family gas vesicle protein [Streptomonospora nanhaiensis]